jgi:hypothetical protein
MWWSKTKEEKKQELENELKNLRIKYANEINSYCKIGSYIFIFRGFEIKEDKIIILYKDENTQNGYVDYMNISWFLLKFSTTDFIKARYEFIKFKEELAKIGLELQKSK